MTRRRLRLPMCALALCAAFFAAAPPASAGIVCERTDGPPGEETTLRIEIPSLDQGDVILSDHTCEYPLPVSGLFSVDAHQPPRDIYFLLDSSGSVAGTIMSLELDAAEAAVRALDPATSRVAIITFSSEPILEHPLSADLNSVLATIQDMRSRTWGGGTNMAPALNMVHDECVARGSPATREQVAVMLTDGDANDSQLEIDQATFRLVTRYIRVDTFDFAPPASATLERISLITGGTLTLVDSPSDLVDALVQALQDQELLARDGMTSLDLPVFVDPAAGIFDTEIVLRAGQNRLVIVLSSGAPTPLTLECEVDLVLQVPRPDADVGGALRVAKTEPANALLTWDAAPPRLGDQAYALFHASFGEGPFGRHPADTGDRTLEVGRSGDPLTFYDVRTVSCVGEASYDPFPARTAGLPWCWVPPSLTPGYPLASNLTDPACVGDYPAHPCDPGVDLGGVDRAFPIDLPSGGTLEVGLSNTDLHVVVYDSTMSCLAMGQGGTTVSVPDAGTYLLVVDAPAGLEGDFDLTAMLR